MCTDAFSSYIHLETFNNDSFEATEKFTKLLKEFLEKETITQPIVAVEQNITQNVYLKKHSILKAMYWATTYCTHGG